MRLFDTHCHFETSDEKQIVACLERAKATYEKPHQFTEGIKEVFVNGVNSKVARAGRFLER